jgi:hypothetical protein
MVIPARRKAERAPTSQGWLLAHSQVHPQPIEYDWYFCLQQRLVADHDEFEGLSGFGIVIEYKVIG